MQSLAELDLVNTSSSEESALASALATRDKQHSLLYFYSANCLLCQSIAPAVQQVLQRPWPRYPQLHRLTSSHARPHVQEQERSRSWLNVATVCTDDHRKWAPEVGAKGFRVTTAAAHISSSQHPSDRLLTATQTFAAFR